MRLHRESAALLSMPVTILLEAEAQGGPRRLLQLAAIVMREVREGSLYLNPSRNIHSSWRWEILLSRFAIWLVKNQRTLAAADSLRWTAKAGGVEELSRMVILRILTASRPYFLFF